MHFQVKKVLVTLRGMADLKSGCTAEKAVCKMQDAAGVCASKWAPGRRRARALTVTISMIRHCVTVNMLIFAVNVLAANSSFPLM